MRADRVARALPTLLVMGTAPPEPSGGYACVRVPADNNGALGRLLCAAGGMLPGGDPLHVRLFVGVGADAEGATLRVAAPADDKK